MTTSSLVPFRSFPCSLEAVTIRPQLLSRTYCCCTNTQRQRGCFGPTLTINSKSYLCGVWCKDVRRLNVNVKMSLCQGVCQGRSICLDIYPLPPLAEKASLQAWKPLPGIYLFYVQLHLHYLLILFGAFFNYRDSAIQLHFSVYWTRTYIKNAEKRKKQEYRNGKHTLRSTICSGVSGKPFFFRSVPGLLLSWLSVKTFV